MKLQELQELFEDIELKGTRTSITLNADPKNLTDTLNVTGNVDISYTDIKTLPWKFGKVTGAFRCFGCRLTSLKNCPTSVGGDFYCHNNDLTSLQFCPTTVNGEFWCGMNDIVSLVGIHKQLKHCNEFSCKSNPFKEGGLGLLLIDGLKKITTDHPAIIIIAKYVGQGKRGMMLCQAELIENGYEAFAKL